MFNSISWTQYLGVVALLLIAYYLFVGARFYSIEIRSFLQSIRKLPASSSANAVDETMETGNKFQNPQLESFSNINRYAPQVRETDDTFQQVEGLTTTLKEIITHAVSNNSSKEEFIPSLQLLLKDYQYLKGSPFFVAINNLIESECEKYDFIHLSAEEQLMLWNA